MIVQTLKWLAKVLLLLFTALAIFLIYITVSDYKPSAQVKLHNENNSSRLMQLDVPFTVTTFNIGYGGLDKDQDFFMDGGTMSRSSSKEQTENNLNAVTRFLQDNYSDVYMLQEVDMNSSRSFRINEVQKLRDSMQKYGSVFAYNYKVPWVPVPLARPMGAVQSGLLTLSSFQSTSNIRFDLPGKENWPVQQFELDRGFIETRLPVDNGKELILINLHLSAFDQGGTIRKQQLEFLENYIDQEMLKENYMMIGGDWNHSLPGTDPGSFPAKQDWPEWLQPFPESFGPGDFRWAVDPKISSVRTLDAPYQTGVHFLAVIDGFFVSPNVEIVNVVGHDLHFENSDHNPVTGSFILK